VDGEVGEERGGNGREARVFEGAVGRGLAAWSGVGEGSVALLTL
jgi:hypothetical protein